MTKVLLMFSILISVSTSFAEITNPAFALTKLRSYNSGVSAWGSCKITSCASGYTPASDGTRCLAADESSGGLAGGQIIAHQTDSSTNYTMYYTVGNISQGSSDSQTNYSASSNLDVPTATVIDSTTNYKMIIGVQK